MTPGLSHPSSSAPARCFSFLPAAQSQVGAQPRVRAAFPRHDPSTRTESGYFALQASGVPTGLAPPRHRCQGCRGGRGFRGLNSSAAFRSHSPLTLGRWKHRPVEHK